MHQTLELSCFKTWSRNVYTFTRNTCLVTSIFRIVLAKLGLRFIVDVRILILNYLRSWSTSFFNCATQISHRSTKQPLCSASSLRIILAICCIKVDNSLLVPFLWWCFRGQLVQTTPILPVTCYLLSTLVPCIFAYWDLGWWEKIT